jgi:mannose-6-phosphate isomerase-like protein (cupin superfamily)
VRRVVAWVVLVVVVGVVAAGCGGGGGDAAGAVGSLAEVVRIDDRVDVRLGDAVELTAVSSEAQPVELGDLIRTDGSGFAEVTYFDGSLTRLDVDTEFTVVALSDAPEASVVRSEMGVGRTWQRVEELSGEDVFEVETAVATAVVRGTAFVIECPSPVECSFSVFEGSVEVVVGDRSVVVEAGESVTVTAEEVGEPGPLVGDPLVDDGWLARNVGLDDDKGFDAIGQREGETGGDGEGAAASLEDLDTCSFLTEGEAASLLGRGVESVESRPSGAMGAPPQCFWDAGWVGEIAPGSPGQSRVYASIGIRPGSELPQVSSGDGCAERPVEGIGEAALVVECPPIATPSPSFSVLVFTGEAVVDVSVQSSRPITEAEVRTLAEDVVARI